MPLPRAQQIKRCSAADPIRGQARPARSALSPFLLALRAAWSCQGWHLTSRGPPRRRVLVSGSAAQRWARGLSQGGASSALVPGARAATPAPGAQWALRGVVTHGAGTVRAPPACRRLSRPPGELVSSLQACPGSQPRPHNGPAPAGEHAGPRPPRVGSQGPPESEGAAVHAVPAATGVPAAREDVGPLAALPRVPHGPPRRGT